MEIGTKKSTKLEELKYIVGVIFNPARRNKYQFYLEIE